MDDNAETKPRPVKFRRPHTVKLPDPGMVGRQMEATRVVFGMLGGAEAARTFLNEPQESLGGRPLDVAGSSAEGLQRVIDHLGVAAARNG